MLDSYFEDRKAPEAIVNQLFVNSLCLIAQNSVFLSGQTESTLNIYLEEFEKVPAYEDSSIGKTAHINTGMFLEIRNIYKFADINLYIERICKTAYRGLIISFPHIIVNTELEKTDTLDFIVNAQLCCVNLYTGYDFKKDTNYWLLRVLTNILLLKLNYPDIWFDNLLNEDYKNALLEKDKIVCKKYLLEDIRKAQEFWKYT